MNGWNTIWITTILDDTLKNCDDIDSRMIIIIELVSLVIVTIIIIIGIFVCRGNNKDDQNGTCPDYFPVNDNNIGST